jgi:hypothetical protein
MDDQKVVDTVQELRNVGFAKVTGLSRPGIRQLNIFLSGIHVYRDAHIPETARQRGEHAIPRHEAQDSECVCLPLAQVLRAPFLFERALDLTDVAAVYLIADPPVMYSANVFWTRPGNVVRPDIQEFHRDQDDERFLVLFTYLTDVERPEDGPHELQGPDGVARRVYGPAGTMFLADTSYPHRGLKPTTGERGIAWFRWGISERPPANVWDKNEPIAAAEMGARYPDDPRLRESIRLLVAP